MGGCFSTGAYKQESLSKAKATGSTTAPRCPAGARDPPLAEPDVEETVKEVLSETPRPPPPTTRTAADQAARPEVEIIDKAPFPVDGTNGCDTRSEDASEAWSVSAKSETHSASTAPAGKPRRDAAEAIRGTAGEERSPAKYQRKRLVSGALACRRDRSVAAGGSSPSPTPKRSDHAATGRTVERSGKRSVSPEANRAAQELRQNAGRRRASAAAAARANGPRWQMPVDEGGRRLCMQDAGTVDGGVAGSEAEAKESLENPLVSLECFIFL
ncbi:hypothetical protein MUK42_27997 [Musa troglodytarum]|uniref:Uncharacterized protein n=1 Tax=Musa troglodytarum TaxID=320322 RepID=A0A9E7F7R5_9LILI|nr:hypothetical protein MUK42_27997 [Musa troglodytarum]